MEDPFVIIVIGACAGGRMKFPMASVEPMLARWLTVRPVGICETYVLYVVSSRRAQLRNTRFVCKRRID